MARVTYGPQAQKRAKYFFEVLLTYANDGLEYNKDLQSAIQINWQTDRQLVVRAKSNYLEKIFLLKEYKGKFGRAQIREALKRFEDFLEILEDNRLKTQGSNVWHFTLKLWHSRWEYDKNLRQFDLEWQHHRAYIQQVKIDSK